jgi:hypothetical protein
MPLRRHSRQILDQIAFIVALIAVALFLIKLFNPILLSWLMIALIVAGSIPVVAGLRIALHRHRKELARRELTDDPR